MSDVQKVVNEINEKLFMEADSEADYFRYLEYTTTPIGAYIQYMGIVFGIVRMIIVSGLTKRTKNP